MSSSVRNPDDPESQVLFLNFHDPPSNPNACKLTSAALNSVLGMVGLTGGFIRSLALAEKRAILLLASYAVDWRECGEEYDDIVFCFGRARGYDKAIRSGLPELHADSVEYVEHIQATRIKPKISRLRQSSYRLNRGISAVAPPGVAVPQAAGPPRATTSTAISTDSPPPRGHASAAPTTANNSTLTEATNTTVTAATKTTSTPLPLDGQTLPTADDPGVDGDAASSKDGPLPSSTSKAPDPNVPSDDKTSSGPPEPTNTDMSPSGSLHDLQASANASGGTDHTTQQDSNAADAEASNNDVEVAGTDAADVAGGQDTTTDVPAEGSSNGDGEGADTGTWMGTQTAETVYGEFDDDGEIDAPPSKKRRVE
ncbi:hypothetical protein F5X98DRAFT_376169 [Xylaria grammica]|nr:hypothetical protein F5X98DRAFT_376169 [Xylaria grammica]